MMRTKILGLFTRVSVSLFFCTTYRVYYKSMYLDRVIRNRHLLGLCGEFHVVDILILADS